MMPYSYTTLSYVAVTLSFESSSRIVSLLSFHQPLPPPLLIPLTLPSPLRLETQMFCSFEEECGAGPSPLRREKSSEVTFFEESILAKKNRSALSYKSFTPFLSDTRYC